MRSRTALTAAILFAAGFSAVASNVVARTRAPDRGRHGPPQRVLVQDGSTVHNVGELHLHVGNWGMFGSMPGFAVPYSDAPSAQWPAGSGVEYLFDAGLWVGAIRRGVPAVTTSHAFEFEFRPTQSAGDTMFTAAEGDPGGTRVPSPRADDDRDGIVDEDWLNGLDDDRDGLVDEDFAAVSTQMFACRYRDDLPASLEIFPEHNPLHLSVRQESYQWEEDRFDDFVGINYWITNIGNDVLEDVYIAFFCDADAGKRGSGAYWEDDATGLHRQAIRCTDLGPVSFDVAYTYDADGDNGATPGYFGVMFLGHTTDPTGERAPERVGIRTFASFSGSAPFEDGGDPTNDFERYELMSSGKIMRDQTEPRDYRILVAAGPFRELPPGETLVFQTAFVVGAGLAGMNANAANAQLVFNGSWFDLDEDRSTGIAGRETPVVGPATVQVDSCRPGLEAPVDWESRDPIWINNDCADERLARLHCGYTLSDTAKFMTGIGGREGHVAWIVGTAPPPPVMRIDDRDPEGVAIYWDDYSESVPDVKTLELDFEGYRIWRADGWTRPPGSTKRTGPSKQLWKLMSEADVMNDFGEDSGLDRYRYAPLGRGSGIDPGRREDLIEYMAEWLTEFPGDPAPCPPGFSDAVCDTLRALAARRAGLPGGRAYYRFVDRAMHRGERYFYAVTAFDHWIDRLDDGTVVLSRGKYGDPAANFGYTEPRTPSQPLYRFDPRRVYVVPNPATRETMAEWALNPNNDDPTGVKVEFRNLPATSGMLRIYTLAGDLVTEIPFDGNSGVGTVAWDLVTRNGQDVSSGVYVFSVAPRRGDFEPVIGKFTVIR